MIPQNLTFVDLETTGGSPNRDRIIEIGIVRVENGKIVKTYDSLVDPQEYIPPEITNLTGITAKLLESSPTFRQQKEKIDEIISDSVIVAHNSRFDTTFLKAEYKRLGLHFNPKQICTAKLSRMMFPRFKRHNLDSVIERFGLSCEPRHRAFPDARVLWDFFQILLQSEEKLDNAIKLILKRPALPKGVSEKLIDKLPEKCGVYTFYGDGKSPLYIGKSVNIRSRVMSHFYDSQKVTREFHIFQQTRHIEFLETEGELEALLTEKKLITSQKPIYNRKLRETKNLTVLVSAVTPEGYHSLTMKDSTQIDASEIENILGVYKSKLKAKNALTALSKEHFLCNKLLGLEKVKGKCFGSQIENCFGACAATELPVKYNLRFGQAFSASRVKSWPYPGPIIIPEGNKGHLVYKWCYLGLLVESQENEIGEYFTDDKLYFDWDTYKILSNYLLKPGKKLIRNFRTISRS